MANKRSWSEMSTRARVLVVVGGIVELVVTSIALRDIRQRDTRSIRGPKWMWGLICFVQPVGPIAYLTLGRRSSDS